MGDMTVRSTHVPAAGPAAKAGKPKKPKGKSKGGK